MDLSEKFSAFIKEENLFQKKDRLLIAVSGGADSAVLCALCKNAGYEFAIAHCNFMLRGVESDRDEIFVRKLGEQYGVKVFIKKFDTAAAAVSQKTSVEETARNLRYEWFREILQSEETKPLTHILTGHHADDNVETVMMNFFRGTGIKGMRGILPKQGKIVRPLLFAKRKEIEAFAAANNIAFVTDSTNAENNYTRNFFRNEIIPATEKVFPQAAQNILNNISRFADIELLYNESIEAYRKNLLEKTGEDFHIHVGKLEHIKPLHTILYELIKPFGFTAPQVHEARKLLRSESGKYIVSATHRILRNRNRLIISPLQTGNETVLYIIEPETANIIFAENEIKFSVTDKPAAFSTDTKTAYIDASLIKYPVLLRRWKPGDYFYPLGMKNKKSGGPGKKKLSRFFTDIKLSVADKEKVWVIESQKKIVWVVGYRIDDRFKVSPQTTRVLKQDLIHHGQKGSGA